MKNNSAFWNWNSLFCHYKLVQLNGQETLRRVEHRGSKYNCSRCRMFGEIEEFDDELSNKGLLIGSAAILLIVALLRAIITHHN